LAEVMARCEHWSIVAVHISAPHHNRRRQNLMGFPDLFLCASRQVAFAELKTQGEKPKGEQVTWRYRLQAAGRTWRLWRPSDLASGLIDRELEALAGGRLLAGPDDVGRDFAAAMAAPAATISAACGRDRVDVAGLPSSKRAGRPAGLPGRAWIKPNRWPNFDIEFRPPAHGCPLTSRNPTCMLGGCMPKMYASSSVARDPVAIASRDSCRHQWSDTRYLLQCIHVRLRGVRRHFRGAGPIASGVISARWCFSQTRCEPYSRKAAPAQRPKSTPRVLTIGQVPTGVLLSMM